MSKFAKPKAVTEEEIERVIRGAGAVDDPAEDRNPPPAVPAVQPVPADAEVRFTMTLPGDMAGQVDIARKKAGSLTRLSWIRVAIAEKLDRDGI